MSDLESDDDIPELALSPSGNLVNGQNLNGVTLDDDRRAHHNALERKRRDHIKDSFSMLREVVPTLKGEKASRALILKKAADYIYSLKTNVNNHHKDITQLKRQNALLEAELNVMEQNGGQQSTEDKVGNILHQQGDTATNVSPPSDDSSLSLLPNGVCNERQHEKSPPNAECSPLPPVIGIPAAGRFESVKTKNSDESPSSS